MANQVVYGIVSNRAKAEQIIQGLVDMGINSQDISFLSSQGNDFKSINTMNASDSSRNWRNEDRLSDHPSGAVSNDQYRTSNPQSSVNQPNTHGGLGTEKHTKAPEGASTGATTGGVIGGVLGLLAGIGALAIPGIGPFVAAGPLMATLGGMGLGGALGTVVGALVGLGIPEYEAKRYESHLKQGGILLAIRANSDDFAKRIKDALVQHGAEDVTISSEATSTKNFNK